ncbi:DUF3500 domain-containing protein [Aspergillus novofumigatus IBT 16806]|uniref:DUF3500 domain-containing protein n=1 Tax=Aspergillus novofumigatus (strain IBT 16806) TaxID=1392255 RepID=A0A2I1CKB8_ASPN1|nr:uncharacterized protein P174DRAFT_446744 [Aspergillus novofumigatus IBT 16806]PKX98070.1 hypothetical protein P174DRAFT_446744 [Aspergillus novofumigatus IBT 16806]
MSSEQLAQLQKPTGEYRQYLPDLSLKRFQVMHSQDAHEYAHDFKTLRHPPWLHALYMHWLDLLQEPFKGVTTDGNVRPGLFTLQDEGVPIAEIVTATESLLSILDDTQRQSLSYHIDSPEWRTWSNPEFLLSHKGLRLDEVTPSVRDAIMRILETTLSPEGYDKAVKAMRINHFLGELVDSPAPWGWSFYGHHLCLNIFLYKSQIIASPWFTGAEPNEIDSGPYAGTRIMQVEEQFGLQLMQSLAPSLQDDQRHLCGAYRDNRVVPYEGIPATSLTEPQKKLLYGILEQYLLYLPARARQLKLAQVRQYEDETYFCWIGGFGDEAPFYYRIQSPVVLIEFDHHSGVFLANEEPKKFHIHTLLRTPNGAITGWRCGH